mmetsp:Transcript_29479/g.81013  ORF Transcript_29479/g.81013 Transcript_29479/m.81013 type:complete len:219 (-) Transcript_29479:281-937(-)
MYKSSPRGGVAELTTGIQHKVGWNVDFRWRWRVGSCCAFLNLFWGRLWRTIFVPSICTQPCPGRHHTFLFIDDVRNGKDRMQCQAACSCWHGYCVHHFTRSGYNHINGGRITCIDSKKKTLGTSTFVVGHHVHCSPKLRLALYLFRTDDAFVGCRQGNIVAFHWPDQIDGTTNVVRGCYNARRMDARVDRTLSTQHYITNNLECTCCGKSCRTNVGVA